MNNFNKYCLFISFFIFGSIFMLSCSGDKEKINTNPTTDVSAKSEKPVAPKRKATAATGSEFTFNSKAYYKEIRDNLSLSKDQVELLKATRIKFKQEINKISKTNPDRRALITAISKSQDAEFSSALGGPDGLHQKKLFDRQWRIWIANNK